MQAIINELRDISITSGYSVVQGNSPNNSESCDAIVLVGKGPASPLTCSWYREFKAWLI